MPRTKSPRKTLAKTSRQKKKKKSPAALNGSSQSKKQRGLASRGKVFRDPVHGLIRIDPEDEFLLNLIDTPEMQRLRRIRQLGVSYVTYHGAEHSRFAHSMGVLAMAQRILDCLGRRYKHNGDKESNAIGKLIQEHGREVKAAALLHDVGHGPFSHMAERAFGDNDDHEDRTIDIISDKNSSVNSVLRAAAIDPNKVKSIIDKTFEFPFLKDIISSQLDADRMDYILRDALFTGVKYGAYDAEWMLNALCIGLEPDKNIKSDPRFFRLCIDENRGRHSAEQLIISRFHMSMQVYFHRVTRGWEAHLLMLYCEATRLARRRKLPRGTPQIVCRYFERQGKLSLSEFLQLDESVILAALNCWTSTSSAPAFLSEMAEAFLNRRKVLTCTELAGDSKHLADRIKLETSLEAEIGRKNKRWLLDKIPFRSYRMLGPIGKRTEDAAAASSTSILVGSGTVSERACPIEKKSSLFRTLGDWKKQSAICRLYYHESVADRVSNVLSNFPPTLLIQ